MIESRRPKISVLYIFICFIAVFLSWILHELAHYTAGSLMGYPMTMTMNGTSLVSGRFNSNADEQWMSAAGPLFTLVEALVVFFLMRQKRRVYLYAVLFTCFYMRLLAACVSFLNPNDEARISASVGLGSFTLPVIMVALLFALVFITSKRYRLGSKFNVLTFLIIMFWSSLLVIADMKFHLHLL